MIITYPRIFKVVLTILALAISLLSAGCGCDSGTSNPYSVQFTPGSADVGAKETVKVTAKLVKDSASATADAWLVSSPNATFVKSVSLNPTGTSSQTELSVTGVDEIKPVMDKYFPTNANDAHLWVTAVLLNEDPRFKYISESLPIWAWAPNLELVKNAITRTLSGNTISSFKAECLLMVDHDPANLSYTFTADAKPWGFYSYQVTNPDKSTSSGTGWAPMAGATAPTWTVTPAADGKAVKVVVEQSFAVIPAEKGTTWTDVGAKISVTATSGSKTIRNDYITATSRTKIIDDY